MNSGYFCKVLLKDIGTVWVAKTAHGLCRLEFGGSIPKFLSRLDAKIKWIEDKKTFRGLIKKLKQLADGKKVHFSEKLDLRKGTSFQKHVWGKMVKISWGDTKSYAWLAKAIGKPKACRAVANACGANPVPIIIPCHRVIASDGTMGGFTSGIKIKENLLKIESSF